MQCFRCDQPALQECARCGALYCDDHGDALCEQCMDPASALPSYRVYRGSLAALLIGSVFAIWLLVRPDAQGDFDAPPPALAAVLPSATPTATPTPAPPARTPTPGGSPVPTVSPAAPAGPTGPSGASSAAGGATPAPTARPATSTPATPSASATPAARSYTIKSGDTIYGIADDNRGATPLGTYVERIYQLNGLSESSVISVGTTIRLP